MSALAVGLAGVLWAPASASASPVVTPICTVGGAAAPCSASWYTSQVFVSWTWTPGATPVYGSGCMNEWLLSDVQTSVSCAVADSSGQSSVMQNINVEVSSPSAWGVPTRPPDHNGWYDRPVTITFSATAFSGIASCSSVMYDGPDNAAATATGNCTDNAGKPAVAAFALRYAAAPPSVTLRSDPGDALVHLRWTTSDVAPITGVRVTRSPGVGHHRFTVIYTGLRGALSDQRVRDGVRYRYWIRVTDLAGNRSTRSVVAVPGPHLEAPAPGAHVASPPILTWTPVNAASYYNVQLFDARGKVLSVWPQTARVVLSRSWRFNGRRHSLAPGRYRWFVWPGFGGLAAARYGRLIGTSTFVMTG